MEPIRPTFDDLGGGLNEADNPAQISDNQFSLLDNFIPVERRIVRRNGTLRKTAYAYSELLTGFMHFRVSSGPRASAATSLVTPIPSTPVVPIFGTPTGFAKYAGLYNPDGYDTGILNTILPAVVGPGSLSIPTPLYSLLPWVFVQMNDVGYAMRKDSNILIRITEASWGRAGIPAPTIAAVISDGGAGNMTAGDRVVVYTFRNSVTGAESNYSPVSNTLALAASRSVAVNGLQIPSDPQVNQIRFYINAPGTSGVYLYAQDIVTNYGNGATINKRVSELGHLASRNNGLPPPNPRAGDIFLDSYLAVTDGVDVFISEAFKPESFSEFNVFDVFKNDGHEVRGVKTWGERLVIGKTNKIHYFTKLGAQWDRETLAEKAGCYSHHSMQVADGILFWYGGDDVYMSQGGAPNGIGTPRIRKLLANIPASNKEYVVGTVYPKHGLYMLACRVDPAYLNDPTSFTIDRGEFAAPGGGTGNNIIIVYNYRTGAWSTFTYQEPFGKAPMFFMHGFQEGFEQALWAVFYDSHYYQMDRGDTDASTLIRARFRTKAWRLTPQGLVSGIRRVFLKITSVAGAITLRLYRDGDASAVKERGALPLDDLDFPRVRDTKGFNMASGAKGATWQIEGEYEGGPPIEIEQMAFEAIPRAERVRVR